MRLFQDEVEVGVLPDDAHCMLDLNQEYILDLDKCPECNEFCSGNCMYYSETAGELDSSVKIYERGDICG